MKNRIEDIRSYVFKAAEALLIDANVWYLIYGPTKPGDRRVAVYSGALAKIQTAKSPIYIDVLILSEFINTCARFKYNFLYPPVAPRPDFKQFRKSPDFKPFARNIAADVRRILQCCNRAESGFSMLDINALVSEFEKGDSDFNDQVLAGLCQGQGWKLVTDDSDFRGYGLTIVTANRHLLS